MVEKKVSRNKKGGMMELNVLPNQNATPMTNYDLANGYSTLQNGGKSKSKRGRKATKGGMMELSPSENPLINSDLARGLSTLQNGGKSKSKRGRKATKGGADPNLNGSSAFYNMSDMVPTATPYTMAEAPVAAAGAPTPFSSGMPNYASVEYGLPTSVTNSLTGGLNQIGGRKSRSKKAKGGELSIMNDLNKILERLNNKEDSKELAGGSKKKNRSKKGKRGGEGEGEMPEMLPIDFGTGGNPMTPTLDVPPPNDLVLGGSKKKNRSKKGKKGKRGGEGEGAMPEMLPVDFGTGGNPMTPTLDVPPPNDLVLGGSKKKNRSKKGKKGGGDTLAKLLTVQNGGNRDFTGAHDWQTQIELDNNSNMPGGAKSKRKHKK